RVDDLEAIIPARPWYGVGMLRRQVQDREAECRPLGRGQVDHALPRIAGDPAAVTVEHLPGGYRDRGVAAVRELPVQEFGKQAEPCAQARALIAIEQAHAAARVGAARRALK